MKKIATLFLRDSKGRCYDEVNPGCEWVLAGEGHPTCKLDGTACLVRDGRLYKRSEWPEGRGRPASDSWLHHDFDPTVRHGHGWLPVGEGPEDWMHRKAWNRSVPGIEKQPLRDGTCELIGPCIGKNPERCADGEFILLPHGEHVAECERTFEGIRAFLTEHRMEGIVWWHNDGRMVKIKRRDYGIPWPVKP